MFVARVGRCSASSYGLLTIYITLSNYTVECLESGSNCEMFACGVQSCSIYFPFGRCVPINLAEGLA